MLSRNLECGGVIVPRAPTQSRHWASLDPVLRAVLFSASESSLLPGKCRDRVICGRPPPRWSISSWVFVVFLLWCIGIGVSGVIRPLYVTRTEFVHDKNSLMILSINVSIWYSFRSILSSFSVFLFPLFVCYRFLFYLWSFRICDHLWSFTVISGLSFNYACDYVIIVLFFLSAVSCLFIYLSCSCMGHVAWIKLIEYWSELWL